MKDLQRNERKEAEKMKRRKQALVMLLWDRVECWDGYDPCFRIRAHVCSSLCQNRSKVQMNHGMSFHFRVTFMSFPRFQVVLGMKCQIELPMSVKDELGIERFGNWVCESKSILFKCFTLSPLILCLVLSTLQLLLVLDICCLSRGTWLHYFIPW